MGRSVILAALVAALGCKGEGSPVSVPPSPSVDAALLDAALLTVSSADVTPGGSIAVEYTCDGADTQPALAWTQLPAGARSIAIVVDDPDAPGGTFTHLVAFDVPTSVVALARGQSAAQVGGRLGKNDFGEVGYSGPCPPKGQLHHYRFRVMALDALLGISGTPDIAAFEAAARGHVLDEGLLVGTFKH